MKALGVRKRRLSALTCLTLLCAHHVAFAQSSPESSSPHTPAPISSSPTATPVTATPETATPETATPDMALAPRAVSASTAPREPSGAHSSRLPAFIAFGLGGVAAGGAVLTGIVANADYNEAKGSCSPACSDRELSPARTLALTSTILTGVAVLGVGVGLTLLFTSGPDPAQLGLTPRLRVAGAPGAARAEASWSF